MIVVSFLLGKELFHFTNIYYFIQEKQTLVNYDKWLLCWLSIKTYHMIHLYILSRCSCWTSRSVAVLEICRRPWTRFPAIFWPRVITDSASRLSSSPTRGRTHTPRSPSPPSAVNYNVSKPCIHDHTWQKDVLIFNTPWITWLAPWLVMSNRKTYWCKLEYCSLGCCLRPRNSRPRHIEEPDSNTCGIDPGYLPHRLLYTSPNFPTLSTRHQLHVKCHLYIYLT